MYKEYKLVDIVTNRVIMIGRIKDIVKHERYEDFNTVIEDL